MIRSWPCGWTNGCVMDELVSWVIDGLMFGSWVDLRFRLLVYGWPQRLDHMQIHSHSRVTGGPTGWVMIGSRVWWVKVGQNYTQRLDVYCVTNSLFEFEGCGKYSPINFLAFCMLYPIIFSSSSGYFPAVKFELPTTSKPNVPRFR